MAKQEATGGRFLTGKSIPILELQCLRCGAKFYPIVTVHGDVIIPKRCRSRQCSSPYWNKQRVRRRQEK